VANEIVVVSVSVPSDVPQDEQKREPTVFS
jgi:hypothetical protein